MWSKSIVLTGPELLTDGLQASVPSLACASSNLDCFLGSPSSAPRLSSTPVPLPTLCPQLPLCLCPYPATSSYSIFPCHASPQNPTWALVYQASLHSKILIPAAEGNTALLGETGYHLESPFPEPAPFKCLGQPPCVTWSSEWQLGTMSAVVQGYSSTCPPQTHP